MFRLKALAQSADSRSGTFTAWRRLAPASALSIAATLSGMLAIASYFERAASAALLSGPTLVSARVSERQQSSAKPTERQERAKIRKDTAEGKLLADLESTIDAFALHFDVCASIASWRPRFAATALILTSSIPRRPECASQAIPRRPKSPR